MNICVIPHLDTVDAHTAHHLYHQCLKGELMEGRTVILVSHHVQLCAAGANYIVALDNGRVQFAGDYEAFRGSGIIRTLVQTTDAVDSKKEDVLEQILDPESSTSSTVAASTPDVKVDRKPPRKLVEEEKRAVGRIGRDVWKTYILACGSGWFWTFLITVLVVASLSPVFENGWLRFLPTILVFLLVCSTFCPRYWSNRTLEGDSGSPTFYIAVYAAISTAGLIITTIRWFILYDGSIRASTVLYKRLLESVLFANIRFHDTVSRGRLLNRFGKDFEGSQPPLFLLSFEMLKTVIGIDSSLADNFGRSLIYALSAVTTLVTVSVVGGPLFILALSILGVVYYNGGFFFPVMVGY